MRHLVWGWAILWLLGFAVAVHAEPVGKTDAEVQAVATPILQNLLAGFNEGNYPQYARDFDDTLREAISEKKFSDTRAKILSTLGKYKNGTYLGFLRKDHTTVVLYRGIFAKTDDEVLINLVLSKRHNKNQVTGLWFQ